MSELRYKKIILNNGMPLYLYSDKNCKQVFVNYLIKYGYDGQLNTFEYDGKEVKVVQGVAHFLEHFLGERSKNGEMYNNFKARAYNVNAYTAPNHTSYHFKGVYEIKKSIKELIQAIDDPVFDDERTNLTRAAIIREVSGYLDEHEGTALCLCQRNLFKDFEVYDKSYSTLGNVKTTRQITTEDLYNCYNAFYYDTNKALIIAGNVDEKEIVDYINEVLETVPRHPNKLILPKYDFAPVRRGYAEIKRDVTSDICGIAFKAKKPEGMSNRDFRYCLWFRMDDLLDSESEYFDSLKERNLIEMMGPCEELWHEGYYSLAESFMSRDLKGYEEVFLERLNEKNMTPKDFELMKRLYISRELRRLEDKYQLPADFGDRLYYTDEFNDLDYIKSLTYDRYMELLSQIEISGHTLCRVKPLE